jgi:hypothetical protein
VETIPRIRKTLIGLVPPEHLTTALRGGGHATPRGCDRETLNKFALKHWPIVENCCFEWIRCALVENEDEGDKARVQSRRGA